MKILVAADAERVERRRVSAILPAVAGFSVEQFRWFRAMQAIQGKEFPAIEGIIDVVEDCVYIDISSIREQIGTRSQVVALPRHLATGFIKDDISHAAPIESRKLTGESAWWKQPPYNYDIVRLLTRWVDGFAAFVQQ